MIGYKAFDKKLCCRGFQYEVGKTYTKDTKKEDLRCSTDKGFHFCRELPAIEISTNYRLSESRICEVIAGDVVKEGDVYCTNSITILREIEGIEKTDLINSSNCNYGYYNRGICNNGYYNSGNCNRGDCNSGYYNRGDCNSGYYNRGDCNSGYYNSGNCNSGNCNSGYYNSGNCNNGYYNSGNCNKGYRNSGHRNYGNFNSGNCNSGNCNSGDFNSGDFNSGFFNTDKPLVRMFNKNTKLKMNEINIPDFCYFDLTEWVKEKDATKEEKEDYADEIKACGGFLKTYGYKEAWRIAWDKASKEEHKQILELPNYDNDIFKEITGIDAEAEIKKE